MVWFGFYSPYMHDHVVNVKHSGRDKMVGYLVLCGYPWVGCGEGWHGAEVVHALFVCRLSGSLTAIINPLSIVLRRFSCEHGGNLLSACFVYVLLLRCNLWSCFLFGIVAMAETILSLSVKVVNLVIVFLC